MRKGKIIEILDGAMQKNGKQEASIIVSPIEDAEVKYTIILPWYLRGDMGKGLGVGDFVVFELFVDGTGYCVGRADGTWGEVLVGDPVNLGAKNGSFVALADKVDALFKTVKTLYNSHTHQLGSATTTTPGTQWADTPEINTAATKARAK